MSNEHENLEMILGSHPSKILVEEYITLLEIKRVYSGKMLLAFFLLFIFICFNFYANLAEQVKSNSKNKLKASIQKVDIQKTNIQTDIQKQTFKKTGRVSPPVDTDGFLQ